MEPDPHHLLAQAAQACNLSLTANTSNRLLDYLTLLCRWGRTHNLTAEPEPSQLIIHHLPDSFMLASALSHLPHPLSTIVDIGSGGGLPALVLSILYPQARFTLVESNAKKCSFLRTAVHQLALPARILNHRFEQLTLEPQDLALSRATLPPVLWLCQARRLIHPMGLIALFTADRDLSPLSPGLALRYRYAYRLLDGTPRCLSLFAPDPDSGPSSCETDSSP